MAAKKKKVNEQRDEPMSPSYYAQAQMNDIVTLVKPLLLGAGYKLRDADGKIYAETSMAFDTPWHHVHHAPNFDCHLWHKIMFDVIYRRLGRKYVPLNCHNCWKVVCRPKTLDGLFALLYLQKGFGRPAKCGIEVRETVCGLYGGYFYNANFEEGLQCYRQVRDLVDGDEGLGPDTAVVLKRG